MQETKENNLYNLSIINTKMTIDEAIDKIIDEMQEQNLFPVIHVNLIKMYLYMASGIGFDKGNRVKSHEKPVIQLDKNGIYVQRYDSATIAGRRNNTCATNITKVCRGVKHQHKGYIWKYEHNERNIANS